MTRRSTAHPLPRWRLRGWNQLVSREQLREFLLALQDSEFLKGFQRTRIERKPRGVACDEPGLELTHSISLGRSSWPALGAQSVRSPQCLPVSLLRHWLGPPSAHEVPAAPQTLHIWGLGSRSRDRHLKAAPLRCCPSCSWPWKASPLPCLRAARAAVSPAGPSQRHQGDGI